MLQSDQNENGKKTEDTQSNNDNAEENNQKDKSSKKEQQEENDGKEDNSQEIKAIELKEPEHVEAELLRMKEIAFLYFKDLKDPLPEKSNSKKQESMISNLQIFGTLQNRCGPRYSIISKFIKFSLQSRMNPILPNKYVFLLNLFIFMTNIS